MTLYVGSKKIAQKIGVASTGVKLPDQTDNAGKFLSTDGTVLAWTNPTEQVEQDIASINEKLIKKTHMTNCITEIPQDVNMTIQMETGDKMYAWVNYIVGYVLYSKTENVVDGDELYSKDDYGNFNASRVIGENVTIVDETTLQDDVNMGYNLTRNSEYDTVEYHYDLTLKAGAKLYFPNGLDAEENPTTEIRHTNEDIKIRNSSKLDGRYLLCMNDSELLFEDLDAIVSGKEFPTEGLVENQKFFNVTTNRICQYNGTEWIEIVQSLPFAVIVIKDYEIYDFDEVFNGFGFMGNLVFALPGVKALLPYGKNEDGSYNSVEYVQENITMSIRDWEPTVNEYLVYGEGWFGFEEKYFEQTVQPDDSYPYSFWYNPSSNHMSYFYLTDWYRFPEMCVATNISKDSAIITDWNIKKVFKIADQIDLNDRINETANELETVFDTKLNNKIDEVNTEINEVRGYAETVQENVETVDTKLEEFKQTIQVVNALPENPETGVLYFVRA